MLTAEEDRDLVRRHWADQAREKELMGSTTGAYNSDRYVNMETPKQTYIMDFSGWHYWEAFFPALLTLSLF
jgi:hypothetical protein